MDLNPRRLFTPTVHAAATVTPEFERELVRISAEVLANCRNGRLYFIGRSPEHMYDYLTSAFARVPQWRSKMHLVLLSMCGFAGTSCLTKMQRDGMRSFLASVGLHPRDIIGRKERTGAMQPRAHGADGTVERCRGIRVAKLL